MQAECYLHKSRIVNGSDLRSRRLRLGLSRDALAHQIGVTPEVVTEWEVEEQPIRFPSAVEQVLRKSESDGERRDELR